MKALKQVWAYLLSLFVRVAALSQAPTAAPQVQTLSPAVPPASMRIDLADGFDTRAAFDDWASRFQNAVYLDGVRVHDGFGPAVNFVTDLTSSRITLK